MHGRQNREKVLFTMSRHTVLVVFVLNALIGWLRHVTSQSGQIVNV